MNTPIHDRIVESVPDAARELFKAYIDNKDVETRVKLKVRIKVLLDLISVDTVNPSADLTRIRAAQLDSDQNHGIQPRMAAPRPAFNLGLAMPDQLERMRPREETAPATLPMITHPDEPPARELTQAQREADAAAYQAPAEAEPVVPF